MSLSMWAESRRDTTSVAIIVGRITSGHYRCRCQCGQNHVGTLQVSLYQCGQNHFRTLQVSLSMWAESRRDTTGVAIIVGRITSGHYRCRYQCGQNHVGALQVSLSGHHRCRYQMWAELRRSTTGIAVNVGRITSGHYRCRYQGGQNHVGTLQMSLYQCGQNHVGTLQVSLSMRAESRRDTTNGAIAVDHPSSPNSGSDEKTRDESRVIAGRHRCYGTQPTMSAVGVTGVHMHEEQIAP